MTKKAVLGVLLLVLAALGAGIWWLAGNLDSLAKRAIETQGSTLTGARVTVGSVHIAPADGKGEIVDLEIGNPAGFKTTHLAKVGRIELEIDLASLTGDVVLIRRIAVLAPDLIYEKGAVMTNIDAIQKNIAAALGPSDPGASSSPGKKLIVEEFTVRGAKAQASAEFMAGQTVAVTLPNITLRNIGKAKGGVTSAELGQEIAGALKNRLTAAISFDRLLKGAGKALEQAGEAIKGLFK